MGKSSYILIGLACALPLFIITHLFVGTIELNLHDFSESLFNYSDTNTNQVIAREFRIPRMLMAIIAGGGLSVAGLLMQNLFSNPLAGPNVLGVSTGSSLFVAFSIMTGIPFLSSDLGIISSALIGAFVFGLIILVFNSLTRSATSLLLVGVMIASFTGAIVSILQTASDAQELKLFALWAMGSLQHVSFEQLPLILLFFLVGIIGSFIMIRSLNAMNLGEETSRTLGINVKRFRWVIILITALLTGLITAYCGPIAFVGLAIPNLVKIVFKTQQHQVLIVSSLLLGMLFMLLCDIIIQATDQYIALPINALTSMLGAPFIIYIIIRRMA